MASILPRPQWVNPCAEYISGKIKIHLHFLIFLKTETVQVFQITTHRWQGHFIPWLVMSWLRASPGHQQPQYWTSSEILWFQHQSLNDNKNILYIRFLFEVCSSRFSFIHTLQPANLDLQTQHLAWGRKGQQGISHLFGAKPLCKWMVT